MLALDRQWDRITPCSTSSEPIYRRSPSTTVISTSQKAAAGTSFAASLFGSVSPGTMGRAQTTDLVQSLFECGTEDKFDLEPTSNPVGLPLLDDPFFGAAVFDVVLTIAFIGFAAILYLFVMKKPTWIPGFGFCAVLYFLQPVTYASFHGMFYGDHKVVVAVGWVFIVCIAVFLVFTVVVARISKSHEDRYWVLYGSYKESRRWFITVELLMQIGFSFITVFRASSSESICQVQISIIAGICLVHIFLLWLCRPFQCDLFGEERFSWLSPDMIVLTITDALIIGAVFSILTMSATNAAQIFLTTNNSVLNVYSISSMSLDVYKRFVKMRSDSNEKLTEDDFAVSTSCGTSDCHEAFYIQSSEEELHSYNTSKKASAEKPLPLSSFSL
eukprot:PhF_6_TR2232/c0_g1_i1/m.3754